MRESGKAKSAEQAASPDGVAKKMCREKTKTEADFTAASVPKTNSIKESETFLLSVKLIQISSFCCE